MEKILGYRRRVSKKKCMTPEILNMMKKRRHVKKTCKNTTKYIGIYIARKAKNSWLAIQ